MPLPLSAEDIAVLRALAGNAPLPAINSHHRLRLELLGLVKDGPNGLKLTPAGNEAARTISSKSAEEMPTQERPVNKRGRRIGKRNLNI